MEVMNTGLGSNIESKIEEAVKTSQMRLEEDYSSLIRGNITHLEVKEPPVRMNVTVDVGTSKTRAIDFRSNAKSVNANEIIRLKNEYAILNETDIEDLKRLEFEEKSFISMTCIRMRNITNVNNPIYNKDVVISKGLLSDKLLKTSGYSVSNTSKFKQVNEFIINAYTSIIALMYSNMIYFLEKGEIENAKKALNVELNLAFMLPDEEKLQVRSEHLLQAIQGVVEFELPMLEGVKGKFSIKDNSPRQWLDLYGEAESAIYYYLIKNPSPENLRAFKEHGVTVVDCGEGSMDIVFFKERELMTRASSTSRTVNGSALILRTIRNIERDALKNGKYLNPSVDSIKKVLETDPDNLILATPTGDYDISEALNMAKAEIAGEMANIFKNTFEKNTILGVEDMFLTIFAGRTMLGTEKSPSMGNELAARLEEQLNIPAGICKITHPDSNLLGAALKLLMKMTKFKSN